MVCVNLVALPWSRTIRDRSSTCYPRVPRFVRCESCSQQLAASLIRLIDVLLDSPDGFAADMTKVLECLFVSSLVWSVGACVDRKGRHSFGEYLRMVMEDKGLENSEAHQDFLSKNRAWASRDRPINFLPPDDGRLLYDFRFDAKKGQWLPWLEQVSCNGVAISVSRHRKGNHSTLAICFYSGNVVPN